MTLLGTRYTHKQTLLLSGLSEIFLDDQCAKLRNVSEIFF